MLNYTKLWILLESKGMKKTDLTKNKVISPATLAKLGKNETITSDTIEKLCEFLNCQPSDIMEYISDKQLQQVEKQFDAMTKSIVEQLKANGVSEEMFATMLQQSMGQIVQNMYNGGTKSLDEINEQIVQDTLGKSEQ